MTSLIERLKAANAARTQSTEKEKQSEQETATRSSEKTPPAENQPETRESVGAGNAADLHPSSGEEPTLPPHEPATPEAGDGIGEVPSVEEPKLKAPVRRILGRPAAVEHNSGSGKPATGSSGGLHAPKPVGRGLRPNRGLTAPQDIQDAEVADEPKIEAEAEPETVNKTGTGSSLMAAIKGRAKARINGSEVNVNPAALAAVEMGEVVSAEAMLAQLQAVDHKEGEETEEILNAERAQILTYGANRIEEIFATELNGLAIDKANDFAITEMSQIVKLTFMRVKSAPIAWDLMKDENKASVLKALRAMANKRNHSVKARASGKKEAAELSKSLNTITSIDLPDDAVDMLGDFGFTL